MVLIVRQFGYNVYFLISVFFQFLIVTTAGKKLIILHNNNFYGKFEGITPYASPCTKSYERQKSCIGGFARISTTIKEYKKYCEGRKDIAVIYLYTGGILTGTVWYTVYRSRMAAVMMDSLSPEAMSLGYEEFEHGTEDLAQFVDNVNFPVVAANLDRTKEASLNKIVNSVMLDVNDIKIGIVGHTLQGIREFARIPNTINFTSEVEAVKEEADDLRNKGANLIVALGSSNWSVHSNIATQVDNVDIVVGSMVNKMLYNGEPPGREAVDGPYPEVLTQNSGKQVYLVSTYGYTKYLGCLNVTLSDNNEISQVSGLPIYMSQKITQDSSVLETIAKYQAGIDLKKHEVLATTRVSLQGHEGQWQLQELNFGNFITDAYIMYTIDKYPGKYWTNSPVAFIHSGMISRSIKLKELQKNAITLGDVLDALPMEHEAVQFNIQGKYLRRSLEHSVNLAHYGNYGEKFLQFAGIQVHYNLAREIGRRVQSINIRCGECRVPSFHELRDNETYRVLTLRILAEGYMGFNELKHHSYAKVAVTKSSTSIVIDYMKKMKIVFPAVANRIVVENLYAAGGHMSKENIFTLIVLWSFVAQFCL